MRSTTCSGTCRPTRSTRWSERLDDRTGYDSVAFALAYLHPLWMIGSLALAAVTLRVGLALRRARRLGQRPNAADYRRHLRLAKPTLLAITVGFAGGIASSLGLRGWTAFSTAHGAVAALALLAFLATGALGRRLERGDRTLLEWHARIAALAVLLAAASIGTGFVLLP